MIIPYAISQTFLIDSCVSFGVDVLDWAMFLFQTVFFGLTLVSSYKLYQFFNVYLFPEPKKTSLQQVMTKSSNDVLSIALQHGVNAEGQLYRLKRGTKLRIVPGASLLGRNVALYCNYPVTGECNVKLFHGLCKSIGKYRFLLSSKKSNSIHVS